MFDRLDTLIAFATIMLGISLLITIINQMVASLLGHRGTYLRDGIKDLIETLDPNLANQADTIAEDVLTHKLVSDSIFARVQLGLKRWKLLISLAQQSKLVSNLLQRWRLATSIRPEELTKVLRALSLGTAAGTYGPEVLKLLDQVDPSLERDAKLLAEAVNTAVATTSAANTAGPTSSAGGTTSATNTTVATTATAGVATADQILKQLSDKADKAVGRVEAAFNSTMDRVRQRFTMQMRIWTIFFALIFAFVYHLDAAKIYSQLSTDPALRESISSASKTLLEKYPDINKCQPSSTPTAASPASGAQQPGAQSPPQNAPTTTNEKAKADCDVKNMAAMYKDVQTQLSDSKLALFEVPKPWLNFNGLDFLRILATAALLSLGAPFWYNALKSLVNLRSQVAEQQSKEAKA